MDTMKKFFSNALYVTCLVTTILVIAHECYLAYGLTPQKKTEVIGSGGSVHRIAVRYIDQQKRYKTVEELEWHILDENDLLKDNRYLHIKPGTIIAFTLWR